jgi:hypothetical protein
VKAWLALLALAACNHAEDPLTARSKQFCRGLATTLDLEAKHLERACAKPDACKSTDAREEDVGDPEARVAIQTFRGAMQLGVIELCAPDIKSECPFFDYACMIRVGHALAAAPPN